MSNNEIINELKDQDVIDARRVPGGVGDKSGGIIVLTLKKTTTTKNDQNRTDHGPGQVLLPTSETVHKMSRIWALDRQMQTPKHQVQQLLCGACNVGLHS